jgi:hypothetical protein
MIAAIYARKSIEQRGVLTAKGLPSLAAACTGDPYRPHIQTTRCNHEP